MGHCQKP